ncbi:MAG: LPS export ABC transporter periplasmic protein LptC [bacterium]
MPIKDIRNKILCFFSLGLFVLGTAWFWLHKNTEPKQTPPRVIKSEVKPNGCLEENAEIVIKDLILKEVEKHKGLEFVINASEGKILNSTDKIECKNIACVLNNNHKKTADLRSNNAVIHKTTKNVFLSGNTVGHTCDMTICGQDISYNYSSQMLTTNKEISYSHQLFSLIAKKSHVDLKSNKIVMSGGVKSEFLNSSAGNRNAD